MPAGTPAPGGSEAPGPAAAGKGSSSRVVSEQAAGGRLAWYGPSGSVPRAAPRAHVPSCPSLPAEPVFGG